MYTLTVIDKIGTFSIVTVVLVITVASSRNRSTKENQFVQNDFLVYVFLTILLLPSISSQLHAVIRL